MLSITLDKTSQNKRNDLIYTEFIDYLKEGFDG